ncbi:Fic family protein [Salibacter halophilus]|uniref:Fic family protein n=1 Tax=Salibacter halophilus TaxID=1803916 RepID=A0A6N6ME47_9FLAO|nr:Fic family protein [Salibacter halophilus]KAB1065985.1 Fic family protein [Salibacter halophilus]
MKPLYDITPKTLQIITSISEKIGAINEAHLDKPSPKLRKENKVKTIQSSLRIEGNTLSGEQITALIDNKRVVGPQMDVEEVMNAIQVYEQIKSYNPLDEKSYLACHKKLMQGLVDDAGKYRKKGVGIVKGSDVEHYAPPHENVPFLMKELFNYLKLSKEIELVKSCVFHYEMEFIHPFTDGNGRMGRLWQTLILMQKYPLFEYLPFETLISNDQDRYYKALSDSDKAGNSTSFIEYMLGVLDQSLDQVLNFKNRIVTQQDRLEYFVSLNKREFTRKDYMEVFKDISAATASRDLRKGVELDIFNKTGDKKKTKYKF